MTTENGLIVGLMATLFLVFGYMGVPVAFSLLAGVLIGAMFTQVTLASLMTQLFNGIDAEALMAIPFFLLVGELMTSANVVVRIANLSQALVGHIRGGLAQVVTVFSMFFSGMSGSSSADVAVLSRTMAKPMAQEGYDPAFVAALIAAAATIANLVPPSIMAVVYGAIGNVSIAGLFLGGIVPGFMIGFGLMIYCYFFGPPGHRRRRSSFGQLGEATKAAGLPLVIPVILLGGILTGWFTPTEAGVIAITYILVVVIPILNLGHIRHLPRDFAHAGLIYSLPLITIGAASAFWLDARLPARTDRRVGVDFIGRRRQPLQDHVRAGGVVYDRRRLYRAGAVHRDLYADRRQPDRHGRHQLGAYGCGADRDPGVRPDHAALRARLADGVEICRRAVLPGACRVTVDLCGFLCDDRGLHLCPRRGAVSAAARLSGIDRLFQEPDRRRLHLSLR
jgi:Tripartite ATP-independent periplasmic transporter, DctM component